MWFWWSHIYDGQLTVWEALQMGKVNRARMAARVALHGVARHHFKYPPLEDNMWYLPDVLRWQPWDPEFISTRSQGRLVGALIIPSYVYFRVPTHRYVSKDTLWQEFKPHLAQRMGGYWIVEDKLESMGVITAERMDVKEGYISEAAIPERHMLSLPAPPSSMPRERRSLLGSLVRGVLLDGYSREDSEDDRTAGHSPGDGA